MAFGFLTSGLSFLGFGGVDNICFNTLSLFTLSESFFMGFLSGLGSPGGLGGALLNEKHPPTMNEFARYVGDITIRANHLQLTYHLFVWKLLKIGDSLTKSLWEYAGQDRSQRNMLEIFIPLLRGTNVQNALKWSITSANYLSEIRNAFVHTPIVKNHETGEFAPLKFASKTSHQEQFKKFKSRKCYKDLLDDYKKLDEYTFLLFKHSFDKRRTFPKRPELTYVPAEKMAKNANRRLDERKGKNRLLQSSPP